MGLGEKLQGWRPRPGHDRLQRGWCRVASCSPRSGDSTRHVVVSWALPGDLWWPARLCVEAMGVTVCELCVAVIAIPTGVFCAFSLIYRRSLHVLNIRLFFSCACRAYPTQSRRLATVRSVGAFSSAQIPPCLSTSPCPCVATADHWDTCDTESQERVIVYDSSPFQGLAAGPARSEMWMAKPCLARPSAHSCVARRHQCPQRRWALVCLSSVHGNSLEEVD